VWEECSETEETARWVSSDDVRVMKAKVCKMGGACSMRVNMQGRKLLSGRLRNTANRVWSVHWCYFVNTVPNIVHSIQSAVFHHNMLNCRPFCQ